MRSSVSDIANTTDNIGDQLIKAIHDRVIYEGNNSIDSFHKFVALTSRSTKKSIICSSLRILAKTELSTRAHGESESKSIGGAAALLHTHARNDADTTSLLLEWLSSDGLVQDLAIRRAVIAALAADSSRKPLIDS